jgi:hypothetical protein
MIPWSRWESLGGVGGLLFQLYVLSHEFNGKE